MPDARERSPLFYAVKRGDVIRVRQLLQSGVNPDDPAECRDARTPLTVAAARGNTVLLRLLLDYGAKADAQALVAAAFENYAEAVRFIAKSWRSSDCPCRRLCVARRSEMDAEPW